MCQLINNNENYKLEVITIKYFEPGHTYMSADSFHHAVEQEIRRKRNLLDFKDFEDTTNATGISIVMDAKDFRCYE